MWILTLQALLLCGVGGIPFILLSDWTSKATRWKWWWWWGWGGGGHPSFHYAQLCINLPGQHT